MRLPWLYLLIFFGGGGGDGRVPSNPYLADLPGTQYEGATVFYKCRDRESPLTHLLHTVKHQTADTTWFVGYLPTFTPMWL